MARLKILPRADWYFIRSFLVYLVLCMFSLMALITVGDLLQNTDEFAAYAKAQNQGVWSVLGLTLRYYSVFAASFVLKEMLPLIIMLAGVFTVTSATVNNEYTVLRSSGISMQRALLPLMLMALLTGLIAEWSQDLYLPYLVRKTHIISNTIRPRSAKPIALVVPDNDGNQHIAIGQFKSEGQFRVYNLLVERRSPLTVQRNPKVKQRLEIYQAQEAFLMPDPQGRTVNGEPAMLWKPIREGRQVKYRSDPSIPSGYYSRIVSKWEEPLLTLVAPSMLERRILGETVMTWNEMGRLAEAELTVRVEMLRRRSEAWGGAALLLVCLGMILRRYVRGETPNYVKNIVIGVFACAVYYLARKAGLNMAINSSLPLPTALTVFLPVLIFSGIGYWFYRDLEHYA